MGLVVGRGAPADPTEVESDNPAILGPAGRLHLTLTDSSKFQRLFMSEGDGLLRPETVERLLTPAPGDEPHQAMGWAPAKLDGVSMGQQGSNTYWVATALINKARDRSALVVTNDGRTRVLTQTAKLATQLLSL